MTENQRERFEQSLTAAAKAETDRRCAIEQTRIAMVRFGEGLADIMRALPREQVNLLGLHVKLVARGVPATSSDSIKVETLPSPSLEEDEFDTRPGATALYLESLGSGADRQYAEIRSSPGTIVLVDSSLDRFKLLTKDVRGIRLENGEPRLVIDPRSVAKPRPSIPPGWFFGTFIDELRFALERAAGFNCGL